jgi:NAD(P)-dependent dehydrogenase (short-subunit alcohol dehydrogenase family)
MTAYVATPADGVAWITGASSGIGRALALELSRRGWRVAVSARSAEALAALAAEAPGKIFAFPGDVTDAERMEAVVAGIEAELGPVVLAVLNAGIYLPVRATPFEPEKYRRSFEVNLMGTVNSLAPVVPRMSARGKGQIWVMASVAGYGALPTSAAYGATKAGLINLAGSLKFDLDLVGVHIGVINPGFVDTPATATNPFEMPFLMNVEDAAKRIAEGIARPRFEITFPRRFAFMLKAMNLLPYDWYLALTAKNTKWDVTGRAPPKG